MRWSRPTQRARWLRGLRTKITFAVTIAVLACAVTVSAVAYESAASYAHKDFETASISQNNYANAYVRNLISTEPADQVLGDIRTFLAHQYMSAVFGAGLATTCTGDSDQLCLDYLPQDLRVDVQLGYTFYGYSRVSATDDESYVIISPIKLRDSSTIVTVQAFTFHDYATDLARLKRHLVELNLAGAALAVLVGLAVAFGVRRPIRRVAAAAGRFGSGDLDVRARARGHDELADLAGSFNAMADRLSTTLQDLRESQTLQRRFVADVSHELRTPLAAMLAAGDGLDSRDPETRDRSAELLRTQTRRLARLVDDLLEMSLFDAGQATLELESTDLVELARDAAHTVAPDADVRISGFGRVDAVADARRMHSVIRNLVANALQHGAPPVDVIVDGRADPIVITVADDGPGVPEDLVETLFDRFVRADRSRTGQGANTGLGLAITRENAALHGATLTVSTVGRTAFAVHLPRLRNDEEHRPRPAPPDE